MKIAVRIMLIQKRVLYLLDHLPQELLVALIHQAIHGLSIPIITEIQLHLEHGVIKMTDSILLIEKKNYNTSGASSYSVSITYTQFQNILNYNSQPGKTDWSYTYNCAGYAAGVWNAATGQTIGGGILTRSTVQNWIKKQ